MKILSRGAPAALRRASQRGGSTPLGVVIGLLIGLLVALIVAVWVAKVPVPFVNKVPVRTADNDPSEAERNRKWDPNAKLGGAVRPPTAGSPAPAAGGASAPPATTATPAASGTPAPYVLPVPPPPSRPVGTAGAPSSAPAAQASLPASPAPAVARAQAPVVTATPVVVPAPSVVAAAPAARDNTYAYFVQAGAYKRAEDAEQQRARLALLGHAAKVTEREQIGRTMYRVRLGPFDDRDTANGVQNKLQQQGVDAALVAVERSRS
jgi:cell division protein FtsN